MHARLSGHRRCCTGGDAYGVLLLNSNGQDIVATNSSLSWRAIGGVLDLFFFLGPTPMAVVEQLTSIVGRPMMAPYWSMGLMNSKCAPRPSVSPNSHAYLRQCCQRRADGGTLAHAVVASAALVRGHAMP